MESNRVTVIRALRAARALAAELLDVRKHQCYDKAFLQLATHIIAETEIVIAHCQVENEGFKESVRDVQKEVEKVRRNYPSNMGAMIVYMSSHEDSIPENPPLEVARVLNVYMTTLQILSNAKKTFHDTLFLIGTIIIREEIAQCEEEVSDLQRKLGDVIEEDERSSRTGEPPSVCFQDQKQATMNRAQQLVARMAKIDAAQRQPESLIQLIFY